MAEGIDYGRLVQELMQVLAAPGREYQGAPYESKDPGGYRYQSTGGELTSDVGWLDPVDMLAGTLAAPARSAVKGLGRQMARPLVPSPAAAARRPAMDLSEEAVNARIKALLQGRGKTVRGTEGLLDDLSVGQGPPPRDRSFREMEEIRDLVEAVKRYSTGQGRDIAPRRVPSGEWPREDPYQNDLAEMLQRLLEGESTPARTRDLQQLLKQRSHGGARVEGDDIVEEAWGWGPQGTPPPWDPDS